MGKVSQFRGKVVPTNVTYSKKITIDSVKGTRVSGDVTFSDVLDLCLGAIVSNAFKVVELVVQEQVQNLGAENPGATKEELIAKGDVLRRQVVEHFYDQMNGAFTYCLEVFAPDIAQHPGLTDLAIMKAEDEIIAAYLDSLPESEREAAAKNVVELNEISRRKLMQHIEDAKAEESPITFTPATPEEIEAEKAKAAALQMEYERDEVTLTATPTEMEAGDNAGE